jgi:hypothetical protein
MLSKIRSFISGKRQLMSVMSQPVTKEKANKPTAIGILIVMKSYQDMPENFTLWQLWQEVRKNIALAKNSPELFFKDNRKYLK